MVFGSGDRRAVWVSSGGDRRVMWVSGDGGFVTNVGTGQVVQRWRGSVVGFWF